MSVAASVAEVDQGVEVGVGDDIDVAASAAVAAIRAAEFFKFLVPEGRAAVAAVARGDVDECFVNEFH